VLKLKCGVKKYVFLTIQLNNNHYYDFIVAIVKKIQYISYFV